VVAYTVIDIEAVLGSDLGQPWASYLLQVLPRKTAVALLALTIVCAFSTGQGCMVGRHTPSFKILLIISSGRCISCRVRLRPRRLLSLLLLDQARQQTYSNPCQRSLVQYHYWHLSKYLDIWWAACSWRSFLDRRRRGVRCFHNTHFHSSFLCGQSVQKGTMAPRQSKFSDWRSCLCLRNLDGTHPYVTQFDGLRPRVSDLSFQEWRKLI